MKEPDTIVPSNLAAEEALLGAVLLNNDAYLVASDRVEADHFFQRYHGRLWEIMGENISAGRLMTPITLAQHLGPDANANLRPGVPARAYLASLCGEGAPVNMAVSFADAVREAWQRRRLIEHAEILKQRALGGLNEGHISELMEEAERSLAEIHFGESLGFAHTIGEAARKSVDITGSAKADERRPGYSTGLNPLDEILGPIMPGHLITLLGASGHGKSALAAQILCHVAQPSLFDPQGVPVGFLSMEMQGTEIAQRVLAQDTGITTKAQVSGDVDEAQFYLLDDAARKIADLPVVIDDTGRQKCSRIIKKLRLLKRRHGIRGAALDHMLLLQREHPRQNKIETIEEAAYALKDAAKELGIFLIVLAQLTRESQKRDNSWRPRDQDLYGGDTLKQASDAMVSVSVPSEWLRQREPDRTHGEKEFAAWQAACIEWEGRAELGALKVRHGRSGQHRKINYDGPRLRFSE